MAWSAYGYVYMYDTCASTGDGNYWSESMYGGACVYNEVGDCAEVFGHNTTAWFGNCDACWLALFVYGPTGGMAHYEDLDQAACNALIYG